MRNIMMLGVVAALTLVAVGTWATSSASSRNQASADRINIVELTKSARDLSVTQYEAI